MTASTPRTAEFFDNMFRENPDPWRFKSLWYERRKRALTLACLPAERYVSGFEPGCANGELSADLATRCDQLLCSDGSAMAVQAARARLRGTSNTEVRRLWLPDEWPNEAFDLIVVSEVAYYLSNPQLNDLIRCALRSLTPNGTMVACHWRHHIAGCVMHGDEVHETLMQGLTLAHLGSHVEEDFRLDVWSHDARSVAQREALV